MYYKSTFISICNDFGIYRKYYLAYENYSNIVNKTFSRFISW